MLKFKILCILAFMLFHCASLMPMEDLNNSNINNLTHLKDNERLKNVSSVEADENVGAIDKDTIEGEEMKDNTNRTGRQFYYNPRFIFIQNNADQEKVPPVHDLHTEPPEKQKIPYEENLQKPDSSDNAEVSEVNTESLAYDKNANTVDYDPIENLKNAAPLTNTGNSDMQHQRYAEFFGPLWSSLTNARPQPIYNWPPPLPTHPPDHHYPTHPPTDRPYDIHLFPIVTSTTRTTTTSTTTTRPTTTNSSTNLPSRCGFRGVPTSDNERIVGGIKTTPYEFPWIVALSRNGRQFCGGSLITNRHILTAAHCIAGLHSWDLAAVRVNLGDHNLYTDYEVKHITRSVKKAVLHKDYRMNTLYNDIAILTLNAAVNFNTQIRPVCLPTSSAHLQRKYTDQIAIVAGWGSIYDGGPQSSTLQKVRVPVWSNTECSKAYGNKAPAGIISSMLCAGQPRRDSCSGDSGGPLVINDDGQYVQIGIVSFGIGCGDGAYPGVYTRVTSLMPWILRNID